MTDDLPGDGWYTPDDLDHIDGYVSPLECTECGGNYLADGNRPTKLYCMTCDEFREVGV
jgi:hypothetical protein